MPRYRVNFYYESMDSYYVDAPNEDVAKDLAFEVYGQGIQHPEVEVGETNVFLDTNDVEVSEETSES